MLCRTVLTGLVVLVAVTPIVGAAVPKGPPPPAEYDVLVRYNIQAFRNERVVQFAAMKAYLEDHGFKEDAENLVGADDDNTTILHGDIASASARGLLGQRYVQTIRLAPKGYKPDKEKPQLIRIEMELHGGLSLERQRQLREQVLLALAPLEFKEAVGYDDRDYLRLVGSIPDKNLDTLASDLRRHPVGWALLGNSFLAELRTSSRGLALLRQILDDWYDHTEGKKILRRILALWRGTAEGQTLLRSLPDNVVASNRSVDVVTVETHLLTQMSENPEAGNLLRELLEDVINSKVNRELMDVLHRRIMPHLSTLNLPLFFRMGAPIRVVEGFPTLTAPPARPAPTPIEPGQEKITPDLREVLKNMAEQPKRRRLELIFALPPEGNDRGWQRSLFEAEPDVVVEGRLGSLITVDAPTMAAVKFAALPEIAVVRLPRVARPQMQDDPGRGKENFEPLRKSGVESLHLMGQRGLGQRVAVVDNDFRGWESLKGKQLPENTRMVDLTRERNRNMLPDSEEGPPNELGHGARYALALLKAAPSVDLTLIRIDPAAPYQLATVARLVNGDPHLSLNIDNRLRSLENERSRLRTTKDLLLAERRAILDDFGVDDETIKRRQDYFKRQADFDLLEKDYQVRIVRYFQLTKEMTELKGVRVVASAMVWPEGYPVDGASTLSRYFDDRPFKGALWFQAAGDTRGQSWSGLFRDVNENGVMEFAPPTSPLPPETWNRELNWLGWQPAAGEAVRELPADARVRITLQWREPHDASFLRGDNAFRKPLADFRVVLFRQLDPQGAKRPADDLEVIDETVGFPQRLDKTNSSGCYEHVLQVRIKEAGRYLVRIEGRAPDSTRPSDAPTIPAARRFGEIRPRLYVETLEGQGRAVWHTYATGAGSLGMPADALRVVTVGAVDQNDQRQPTSAEGPPHNRDLMAKPDVLTYDQMQAKRGTGLANGFAAGVAAAMMHPDTSVSGWFKRLRIEPGEILHIRQEPR
jgi:hypothetical protein